MRGLCYITRWSGAVWRVARHTFTHRDDRMADCFVVHIPIRYTAFLDCIPSHTSRVPGETRMHVREKRKPGKRKKMTYGQKAQRSAVIQTWFTYVSFQREKCGKIFLTLNLEIRNEFSCVTSKYKFIKILFLYLLFFFALFFFCFIFFLFSFFSFLFFLRLLDYGLPFPCTRNCSMIYLIKGSN